MGFEGLKNTDAEMRDAVLNDATKFAGAAIAAILADVAGIAGATMRGTNSALLAASYTAPNNAGITAIQGKTDNLPTDPADQSLVEAAIAAKETYFAQVVPIKMNCLQTLNNTQANKDFVPDNATGASGLISTLDAKVQKVSLLIIGRAVNSYAGTNALDCTTAEHNQWKMNLDGGAYADLVNEETDGQMLDNDWRCAVEGAIHPFTLMFDVTSALTNIDGKIGVQLENGRAEQASLIVTVDVYLRILWKL